MLLPLLVGLFLQATSPVVNKQAVVEQPRTIAIDEAFAAESHLKIGDRVIISSQPGAIRGRDSVATAIVGAIIRRGADPAEIARGEFRIRMHLDQLQNIAAYGDRVDRFAIASRPSANVDEILDRINRVAFGFRAHRSRDIAVETSRTFQVVSRFHRAIGVITIVASSIFLLCIMVLKVEERRRDIAALRLMGISRATVVRAIVAESALIAILGSALGILLGWAGSLLVNWHYRALYRTPLEFSIITGPVVTLAVILSLILGIGAGMLASLRLARTPPLALFGR